MTRTGFALLIGAVFAAGVFAQSGPAYGTLASGTALNAELNSTVDSKKVKVGDMVEAHTTVDLKTDGRIVLPKGTKLFGHITQASARAKGDSESMLAIEFDKAIPRSGAEIPLNVEIRAIAEPQRDVLAGSDGPGNDPMIDRGGAAAGGSPMGASRQTGPPNSVPNPAIYAPTDGSSLGTGAAGPLPANSRGVYGLNGLQLTTDTSKTNSGTIIVSKGKNVHLDERTRLLLISLGETAAFGRK